MISAAARIAWSSQEPDVVVVRWPEQRDELARLDRLGVPRLLLVEPGVEPPPAASCLEDWLRLPAEDQDVRARLRALARRAASHPRLPTVDTNGQLSHRGRMLFLSPLDQRITEALIANFDGAVDDETLRNAAWPEGGSQQVLRIHISRLRRQISALGLTITCVRNVGYLMREDLTATAD